MKHTPVPWKAKQIETAAYQNEYKVFEVLQDMPTRRRVYEALDNDARSTTDPYKHLRMGEKLFNLGTLGALVFGLIAAFAGLCSNDIPKMMFIPFAISALIAVTGMLIVIARDKSD